MTLLTVQRSGICVFTVVGLGSIPGQGTKILQAVCCAKKTVVRTN